MFECADRSESGFYKGRSRFKIPSNFFTPGENAYVDQPVLKLPQNVNISSNHRAVGRIAIAEKNSGSCSSTFLEWEFLIKMTCKPLISTGYDTTESFRTG